jgi:hypothetical protein
VKAKPRPKRAVARMIVLFAVVCVLAVICFNSECRCFQPQTAQKQCPPEDKVRTVPKTWMYCPYESLQVALVTVTVVANAPLKVGPQKAKWCPVQQKDLPEAQTTWLRCPYDGALLEPAHNQD